MKIEIRGNSSVHIEGYVNAVGRDSRILSSPTKGSFVEMIEPGTFRASLERRPNVELLLNHGRPVEATYSCYEDNIGLRAICDITDPEVCEKARNKQLRGWSFGFYVNKDEMEERSGSCPRRHVSDIDMYEVSIIDDRANPCYAGTLIECRADGDFTKEMRAELEAEITVTEQEKPDYSYWEKKFEEIRAREEIRAWEERLAELRFNPYHDPTNGRFTTSDGGGMGGVLYSKGGKSAYVFERDIDSEYNNWKSSKKIDSQKTLADDIYYKKYNNAEEYHKALSDKYNGITSVEKIKTAKDVADFINYDTQKGYYGTTQLLGGQKGIASTWKRVGAGELSIKKTGFDSAEIKIPEKESHVFSNSISKLNDAGIHVGHWLNDKYLVSKKKGTRVSKWLEGLEDRAELENEGFD